MQSVQFHLLCGVLLYFVYRVLAAMELPLLRQAGKSLTPSQTLGLIAAGEALTLLPFVGVVSRQWTIAKLEEWFALSVLGAVLPLTFLGRVICAAVMPLGNGKLRFALCLIN